MIASSLERHGLARAAASAAAQRGAFRGPVTQILDALGQVFGVVSAQRSRLHPAGARPNGEGYDMPRTLGFAVVFFLGAAGMALAQSTPVESGSAGTPITPPQVGDWMFSPTISKSEAEDDALAQGFGHISRLREDDYGDWIGESVKGALVIFPDGRAFPL
jgi:hypothetical protein